MIDAWHIRQSSAKLLGDLVKRMLFTSVPCWQEGVQG